MVDYTAKLDMIIFLLQVIALALSFIFSCLVVKLIIHTKNQKNIL